MSAYGKPASGGVDRDGKQSIDGGLPVIGFVRLTEVDGLGSWIFSSWRIAVPVTQRVYDLERGWRVFGIEITLHDTRTGSVL